VIYSHFRGVPESDGTSQMDPPATSPATRLSRLLRGIGAAWLLGGSVAFAYFMSEYAFSRAAAVLAVSLLWIPLSWRGPWHERFLVVVVILISQAILVLTAFVILSVLLPSLGVVYHWMHGPLSRNELVFQAIGVCIFAVSGLWVAYLGVRFAAGMVIPFARAAGWRPRQTARPATADTPQPTP
jgi:hypothetical protein